MRALRTHSLVALVALAASCQLAHAGLSVTVVDKLYVSDASLFTVKVFNGLTGALVGQLDPPAPGWGTPAGIAVAADGRVYVADNQNNVVYRFSAAGAFIDTFISTGLFEPTGIAFGPDGYLYVANFGNGNNSYISRFDSNGNPVDANPFVPASTGLFDPGAIAFGHDGNLYIADSSNDTIDVVTLPGGAFTSLNTPGCPGTPFTNPQGITLGVDQNLYVSDTGFGCSGVSGGPFGVYKYSKAGALLGTFVTVNFLSSPIDLAFGPDGNLYITDANARVAQFNGTTGAYIKDFVSSNGSAGPLINPTFLAFSVGAAAKIVMTSGSGQSATTSNAFANPLMATVTDLAGNPVRNVTVTFTAPVQTGASATFTGGNTAVTNSLGVATSNVVVANANAGGPYSVVASAGTAATASFLLTNNAPITAIDVSSQVTITGTGYVRNRASGIWTATLTVTNKGTSAIAGPVELLLTNLTAGVTMTNGAGTFNGSPFITVTPGSLAAGGSTSFQVQFTNPGNNFITFTPVTYSGVL